MPPDRGALDIACDGGALEIVMSRERVLLYARCDGGACTDPSTITSTADAFDAVRFEGALFVAHGEEHGPVHVSRIAGGSVETAMPAACWDTEDGLCGAPRLATDGASLALVTRHGADVRALVSEDGARWRSLAGLAQP
jgi:hypothetical protein